MEKKVRRPRKTRKQELESGLLYRELESFRDVTAEPITAKRLKLWVGKLDGRSALMADTLWGTIRWPRGFGLPRTLVLASAFIIEHRLWQVTQTNDQVNPLTYRLRLPNGTPRTWDGPHDDKYRRVSFMSYLTGGNESEVVVDFAKGLTWASEVHPAIAHHREITPSAMAFEHSKDGKPFTLPPFTIVNRRRFKK